MRWFLLIAVVPLVTFGSGAFAAPSQADFVSCQQMRDLDAGIAGCTKIAEDSSGLAPDRAVAYFDRGVDYYSKDDVGHAIADWSEAIKLNPSYVHAYNNRAKAYRAKADYDHAIADYTQAITLDPHHAVAYEGRGLSYLFSGQTAKADADLKQAKDIDTLDPYALLWYIIAARRNNEQVKVGQASGKLNMSDWPAPLLLYYGGQMTAHEVAVAAQNIDPNVRRTRLCDSYFYIGESVLQSGDKAQATDLFQRSVKECPQAADQYSAAVAELKALGKPVETQGASAEGQGAPKPTP